MNPLLRLVLLMAVLVASAVAQSSSGFCRDLGGGCGRMGLRCSMLPNLGCGSFGLRVSGLGFLFPTGVLVLGSRARPAISLPTATPCPTGCTLMVAPPSVTVPFRADRFGLSFVRLPVPDDPSLTGADLTGQAARIDEDGCLQVSNGVQIRIGRGPC